MRSLQFNENNQGYLVLSDLESGQLFYPSDETGLGWLSAAVNSLANIGSAIIGSRASKNANESAERQLQTQQQIQLIAAQNTERMQALQNQSKSNTLSTGEMVGIAIAGITVIGSILYLVSSTNGNQETVSKKSK